MTHDKNNLYHLSNSKLPPVFTCITNHHAIPKPIPTIPKPYSSHPSNFSIGLRCNYAFDKAIVSGGVRLFSSLLDFSPGDVLLGPERYLSPGDLLRL